ncbi:hypothetical protein [Sphingorhabdus sp. SMR4y]|nr:hypothetical protein [Sphingorhabdus sp. SMR4y]ASK90087.1 hypothetical protein SPHFLASMR4Y_03361 [Sphingorhabdus sp. SMR4y]
MSSTARLQNPKRRPVNLSIREAIAAYNQRVSESGPLLVPDWADDNGAF